MFRICIAKMSVVLASSAPCSYRNSVAFTILKDTVYFLGE